MDVPWRKRIRLPASAYLDPDRFWHVTISTENRAARVFADAGFAREAVAMIAERCRVRGAILEIYCLMPDHAHLLVRVERDGLVQVMADVKSLTTRLWWKHGGEGVLWQRSFYDRGIRTEREYDEAVTYIIENPIRAGLVEDWRDYPFIGGTLLAEE